jgi:GNAT superfamily N-acetyltransferase
MSFFFITMKIRIAKIRDAVSIAAQNIALAKESENIVLIPETALAGVKALLSDTRKGFYLVAEENDTIVGQLMITVEWSDWRNKPIWWVQSVYVQKAWRNKGVFTQLLDYVQQKARKQEVAFLRLYAHKNNRSALQVYEKIGWKQDPYVVYHLPL